MPTRTRTKATRGTNTQKKTRSQPQNSIPAGSRKGNKTRRVREGQISRIRRPSSSVVLLMETLLTISRFRARAAPAPIRGVFGGSETGRPAGRPERPPRRSTTRSKSTRSSRLCSVSSSSVLSRSVLLRDVVVVGKIFFRRPEVGLVFGSVSRSRIRYLYFDLWTFSLDLVTSSIVAVVER